MGLAGREFQVDSMVFSYADDERQENLKLTEGEVICSWCGKEIKDKPELGDQVSHSICPECEKKHFGDLEKDDEVDEDSPLYGTDMTEAVMESRVDITQRGYDLSLRFAGVPTERPSGGSQQRYDYLDGLLPQMQSAFKSRGRLKRFSMDTITFQPWEKDWDALGARLGRPRQGSGHDGAMAAQARRRSHRCWGEQEGGQARCAEEVVPILVDVRRRD